jgi:hypothetical protein
VHCAAGRAVVTVEVVAGNAGERDTGRGASDPGRVGNAAHGAVMSVQEIRAVAGRSVGGIRASDPTVRHCRALKALEVAEVVARDA